MSNYYSAFQEAGDLLIDRPPTPTTNAGVFQINKAIMASGAPGNATVNALHCGDWPEQAKKSCGYFINRLRGNSSWARYCACDDCQRLFAAARSRRSSSSAGSGAGEEAYQFQQLQLQLNEEEPLVVTDEQLRMTYEVWGLRPNELPVKGTYVDPNIVPGFKYRVRCLGPSGRPVFQEPLRLTGIGAGYGKRLTFDTKPLGTAGSDSEKRRPVDHFWSDSWPEGYALALSALDVGQRFSLVTRSGQEIGRAVVTWTAPEPAECRLRLGPDSVVASVPVAFRASLSLTACRCLLGCHDYEDVAMTGVAKLERPAGSRSVAAVTQIEGVRLPNLPDFRLLPVD